MAGSADIAWDALNEALEHYAPGCSGLPLFTADSRTDEQRAACEVICARCPIADLCDAYATAAADSGFWAGAERSPKRRRATMTTASGGSLTPTQQKEETS